MGKMKYKIGDLVKARGFDFVVDGYERGFYRLKNRSGKTLVETSEIKRRRR